MSKELDAKRASLRQIERILDEALKKKTPPWTAVSQLTRQQAKLAAEVAKMDGEEERTEGITPERLRAAIMALPTSMIPVAEAAILERKRR